MQPTETFRGGNGGQIKFTGKQLDRQALNAAMNGAKELLKIYGDLSNTLHADNTDLDDS